jgi:hypothetical protein
MIASVVAWLSKRFPEKMVLSLQEYREMREELGAMNRYVQGISDLNDRLQRVERDITVLNASMGFTSPTGHGTGGRLER